MGYGDDLGTRIGVPKVPQKILPRRGIMGTVDNASLNEAVCMVAPYGCGKTLAVISWLRGREAAWLSLDKTDDEEAVFVSDLTAAVLLFFRDPLSDGGFLSEELYIKDPKAFLIDAASRPAPGDREKILVLDNLSHICNTSLLRFLTYLIAACLGDWRIVLMSRAELPPTFNDLILKRYICLITLNELTFSAEEMADYFQMNGCAVLRESILQIRADTEGWPAALSVILTVSCGGPIGYSEAAREYVRLFFETEVWADLDESTRDFMLKTSILETLTPSACHAVTGLGATMPILIRLFQNGLFLSHLEARASYRYHRVFRDFLLRKLKNSDIDEKALCKDFGWWLFEQGELAEAFPYFFRARDFYGLRRVLMLLDITNLGIEGFLSLAGCLTELDANLLKPYPEIVARMALVHYLVGDVSKMQSLYHLLLKWDEPGTLPILPEEYAEFMWELGWLGYLDPNELLDNNKHLEHSNYRYYVPHLQEKQLARLAVLSFPSYFRGIRDYGTEDYPRFENSLQRAEQGEKYLLDEYDNLWGTYLILAEYKYETEDFANSEEIVRRIMPLVEDRGYTYLYFTCTMLLVKLARAALDPGEIGALTARLGTVIMHNGHHFLLPNFHAFELRNRLADGESGFTDVFLEENKDYTDKSHIFLLYRHFTYVRALLSVGHYSEAVVMLGNLDMLCHKYNRPTDLIEVNILRAVALYNLEREDSARRHLTEALSSAKPYGYIRMFSDDAAAIWPILELIRKQTRDTYIQNVVISCKKAFARTGYNVPSINTPRAGLTKSELKILKSLQTDMSYEEIALENGIRVSTVKSHAHSIYSKLGVPNKTSAVIEARRMGLLE